MTETPRPVTLPPATLDPFDRFSLYNSPYPAHDRGHAVDLYPGGPTAPAPVAGVVRDVLTVRAPDRPGAAEHDHLVLVDVDAARTGLAPARDLVARVLHVDPAVAPGDRVAVGDPLGRLVRSGYFAPWVANHVHLDVRPPDRNLRRASGSLPLAVDVPVEPVAWDGAGRVRERGDTYVTLDAPGRPAGGTADGRWVGVAGAPGVALDGGLPHYAGGGALPAAGVDPPATVAACDTPVGDVAGRDVTWRDVTVLANGRPVRGLSLFLGREEVAVKVVAPGHGFAVDEAVSVSVVDARDRPGDT
ncbi:MAG: hypothetical protein ABEJ30_04610 [Halorientalis sp.]